MPTSTCRIDLFKEHPRALVHTFVETCMPIRWRVISVLSVWEWWVGRRRPVVTWWRRRRRWAAACSAWWRAGEVVRSPGTSTSRRWWAVRRCRPPRLATDRRRRRARYWRGSPSAGANGQSGRRGPRRRMTWQARRASCRALPAGNNRAAALRAAHTRTHFAHTLGK